MVASESFQFLLFCSIAFPPTAPGFCSVTLPMYGWQAPLSASTVNTSLRCPYYFVYDCVWGECEYAYVCLHNFERCLLASVCRWRNETHSVRPGIYVFVFRCFSSQTCACDDACIYRLAVSVSMWIALLAVNIIELFVLNRSFFMRLNHPCTCVCV